MRKGTAVLVLALLVVPILTAPAHAWGRGGFHHGGGCGFSGFLPGLGIGALATAPLWCTAYGNAYPSPIYATPPVIATPAPSYQAPPPAY